MANCSADTVQLISRGTKEKIRGWLEERSRVSGLTVEEGFLHEESTKSIWSLKHVYT